MTPRTEQQIADLADKWSLAIQDLYPLTEIDGVEHGIMGFGSPAPHQDGGYALPVYFANDGDVVHFDKAVANLSPRDPLRLELQSAPLEKIVLGEIAPGGAGLELIEDVSGQELMALKRRWEARLKEAMPLYGLPGCQRGLKSVNVWNEAQFSNHWASLGGGSMKFEGHKLFFGFASHRDMQPFHDKLEHEPLLQPLRHALTGKSYQFFVDAPRVEG